MRRFAVAFVALFAGLVGLNAAHLGANAAMHWDAATCLETDDPMPTRAELERAAAHVYDLAPRTADPAAATAAFAAARWPAHVPLETVRRYYSQVACAVARGAFRTGRWATGSAAGGVVAFQLAAAALMAAGLAMLVAASPGRAMLAVATAAVATTPVFLSLSRQVLTETVGFPLMVGTVLVAGAALRSRRLDTAAALGAAAGVLAFATVRTRYSFGPTLAVLLTFVAAREAEPGRASRADRGDADPRPPRETRTTAYRRPSGPTRPGSVACIAAALALAACVAIDRDYYGRFILPWAYDDLLVRSTRLYFHAGRPYEPFAVAAYVGWPLLALPVGVVAFATVAAPRRVATWAALAMAAFALLAFATARQQVAFQPRHLFAVTGGTAAVLLATVGHVRWGRASAAAFVAVCGGAVGLNVCSAFGPRPTMRDEFPPTVAERLRAGPAWAALARGYADASDNRRLHDAVVVLGRVGRSTVAVDPAVYAAYSYAVLAPPGGPAVVVGNATTAAFAVVPAGRTPGGDRWERVAVDLDRAELYRRIAVAP